MRRTVLGNGLRILTENRGTKSSSIVLAVGAGSFLDEEHRGLAHLLEHMLLKGSGKNSFSEISGPIQSCGGSFYDPYTEHFCTVYSMNILSRFVEEGIRLLFRLFESPEFSSKLMEKEKSVVANEIRYYRDNPLLHSLSLFGSNLDKRLSLAQGDEKSLNRITPEMLRLFYDRYYAPQNMVISIVGNMEHERVAGAVGSTFGRMKQNRTKAVTTGINPAGLPRTETVLNSGQREAYMLFGGRAPAMPDRRRYAMEVAVAALGKTLNSRLFSRFVDELAISRYVGAEYDPVEGAFTGFVATSAKNLPVARRVLQELLDRLVRRGMNRDELETTKRFLVGYDIVQNEQNQRTAEKYALAELFGKAGDVEKYCARIESVTMDEVNEVARDFMNTNRLLVLITRG